MESVRMSFQKPRLKKRSLRPTLGDVISKNLVTKVRIDRAAQTNWRWRKMAERWGHARLISPTRERETYESPEIVFEVLLDDAGKPIAGQGTPTPGGTPRTPGTPGTPGDELILHSELEDIPENREGQTKKSKKGRAEQIKDKSHRDSVQHSSPAPSLQGFNSKFKAHAHHEVWYCRANDKCVDTSDLDFDPFDDTMRFTKAQSNIMPMYVPAGLREKIDQLKDVWKEPAGFTTSTSSKQKQ